MKKKYLLSILVILLGFILISCKRTQTPPPDNGGNNGGGDVVIPEVTVKEIGFKDNISNFEFDLDNFNLGLIELQITYSDDSKEYIKVTKDMVSEEDFEFLFLTGGFLVTVNYLEKSYHAMVTLTSDTNQTRLPSVYIYFTKDKVGNTYEYNFYSAGKENFVSFELNLNLNNTAELVVTEHIEGLFSNSLKNNKLNILYSFGKEIKGNNKLFTISSATELDMDIDTSNSLILKLVSDEVVVEEDVRFYKR